MVLIYISVSLIMGILLGSKINLPLWSLGFTCVPLLFVPLTKHKKLTISVGLCILALLGGILRHQTSLPVFNEDRIEFYNDGPGIVMKGIVASAPDDRDTNTQLIVSVQEVNGQPTTGRILVFTLRYPEHKYGDLIRVNGSFETPSNPGDFDYKGYLASEGIYSIAYYPTIETIDTGKGFKPLSWVYAAREILSRKIAEALPEPQASLAQGILLGIRSEIPQSVKDDFARTGTTHILAISGQNLSIVAGMFIATGIWLFGRKHYLYIWIALTATWGYALLTGFDAPVVRAAIMLSMFFFADLLGRQRSVLSAIAFAATVMLIVNPSLLRDASFQLSFLSVIGLVLVAPFLQSSGRSIVTSRLGEEGALVSSLNWAIDCLAVTIGVTLLVWPVTAYYFGIFSIVSPFATFLILPALSPIIIAGTLTAILGLVATPLGVAAGWLVWLFLSYMLGVIDWFSRLPVAAVGINLRSFIIWGYFAIGAIIVWAFYKKEKALKVINRIADILAGPSKRIVLPVMLVVLILTSLFACDIPDDRLHVSFLDVGQGDAILIQQGAQEILIDGGPSSRAIAVELGEKLPFWDRTIEMIILTHPHADHLTGLLEVLKRYRVKQVVYAESSSTSPLWDEWKDLLKRKNVEAVIGQIGQVIDLGNNGKIEILNSPAAGETTMDNDGIVLRVDNRKISFLLTADITDEKELELIMDRANLECDVLKVAHHGSYTASSPAFLAVASPEIAVISVGADNDYGHPNKETLERLATEVGVTNIYRTDLNGTIEFITDGEKLWMVKER